MKKAFTLIEIIIAMVLNAITVIAALWIFSQVSNFWSDRNKEFKLMSDWFVFEQTFKRDVRNSDFISFDQDALSLIVDENYLKYEFIGDLVVRKTHGGVDTIFHGESEVHVAIQRTLLSYSVPDSAICFEVGTRGDKYKVDFYLIKPMWAYNQYQQVIVND